MLFLHLLLRRAAIGVPQPTAFSATPISAGQINLAWTYGAAGLQTEVWRNNVLLATVAAGVQTYSDTTTTAGVVYAYRIRHKSGASYSSFSATLTRSSAPAAPIMLSPSVTGSDVTINWVGTGDPTITEFIVHRSTAPGAVFSVLANTAGPTSYGDTGRPNGTYYYRVKATNGYVESAESTEVSATVAYAPPLADPSGLSATPTYSDRIALAWTNGDASAVTEIYRGTSPNPTALVGTAGAGATSFTDAVAQGTYYYYRIRHEKASATSAYIAAEAGTTTASLSGVALVLNGTGYDVQYTVVNGPFGQQIDKGTWTDTGGILSAPAGASIGASPHVVIRGYDFVPKGTFGSLEATGTLAYLYLRNGGGTLLDSVTALEVSFNAMDSV